MIEKAQGWAPNSEAADREGTSVSIKGGGWWHYASGQAAQMARAAKVADFKRRHRSIGIEEFAAKYCIELGEIIKKTDALTPFAHLIGKDTLKSALLKNIGALEDSLGKFKEGLLRPPVLEKEIMAELPALEHSMALGGEDAWLEELRLRDGEHEAGTGPGFSGSEWEH